MENEKEYIPITSWQEQDKPREKLLAHGSTTLSNAELIAILLGTGTKSLSAIDLAKDILQLVSHDLNDLGRKTIKELQSVKGIGPAKAITIAAALELGRRRNQPSKTKTQITSSKDSFDFLIPFLADLNHEEFWIILLNKNSKIINQKKMFSGGIDVVIVDVKMIMKIAIEEGASGLILAHNHPSGSLIPSSQDKNITQKIKDACSIFSIQLLDHIIIGNNEYFSFIDAGLL
jgi:DNA repair protein RadC